MRASYTMERANRALPLVERIVRDIVTQYANWQDLVREFELLASRSDVTAESAELERLQREVQRVAADIDACQRELRALGVEVKDYARGLVDFPGERGGRPIYLCWHLGEPSVRFWHEIDAGFAGRQPIEPVNPASPANG